MHGIFRAVSSRESLSGIETDSQSGLGGSLKLSGELTRGGTPRTLSSKTNLADLFLLGDVSCLSLSGQGLAPGQGLGPAHNDHHHTTPPSDNNVIPHEETDDSHGTSGVGVGVGVHHHDVIDGTIMIGDDDDNNDNVTMIGKATTALGYDENNNQVTTTGAVVVGLANIRDLQRARDIRVVKGR